MKKRLQRIIIRTLMGVQKINQSEVIHNQRKKHEKPQYPNVTTEESNISY